MYRRDTTNCPQPDFVEIEYWTESGEHRTLFAYGPIEADVIDLGEGHLGVDIGGTDYGPSAFAPDASMFPKGTKVGDVVYVYREGIPSDYAGVVKIIEPFGERK